DAVGGDALDRAVAATRVGGVVNLFGFAAGTRATVDLVATIRRVVTLRATSGGSTKSFEDLVRAIDSGAPIRPVLDRVVPFEDAPAAFMHLADGRPFGKVVITGAER
ncbi:MAG: alcohol dehydrogenase, partial [Labilithrix sp.]|nr:alcohol dehydrogenase [Labilithrix sp.]